MGTLPKAASPAHPLPSGRVLPSFEQLVAHTSDDLYRLATRLTGDRADAADVLQTTYLQAFEALRDGKYRGECRLETWLYRIATHAAFDSRRLERVEDLKGLKLRVSGVSVVEGVTIRAFGATPVKLPHPNVWSALKAGSLDGYSSTAFTSVSTAWYPGASRYTETKHAYQAAVLVLSKKWLETLPVELRAALLKRSDERAGIELVRAERKLFPLFPVVKEKPICTLTAQAADDFAAKGKRVWDKFGGRSPGHQAILDSVLAAKKAYAAQQPP